MLSLITTIIIWLCLTRWLGSCCDSCSQNVTEKEYEHNWLVPGNITKWKNQWTFTWKQVKKTSKRWWIFEATSKDEVEVKEFLQEQKSKDNQYNDYTRLRAFKPMEEILWVTENGLEQLKTNLLMRSTFFRPNFFSPFVKWHWVRAGYFKRFPAKFSTSLHNKGSLIDILKVNES